jgi:hypothetical protein
MRAAGEYWFEYAKTRNSNGVGKKTLLRWDPIALRISNNESGDKGLKVASNGKKSSGQMHTGGTVLDKINKSAKSGLFDVLDLVDKIADNTNP